MDPLLSITFIVCKHICLQYIWQPFSVSQELKIQLITICCEWFQLWKTKKQKKTESSKQLVLLSQEKGFYEPFFCCPKFNSPFRAVWQVTVSSSVAKAASKLLRLTFTNYQKVDVVPENRLTREGRVPYTIWSEGDASYLT